MNYRDLEIWKLSEELVIEIHQMTIFDLPKFEMYEEGSQIRRSIKSVKSNIVEGYGRKMYKAEFMHFLVYALASNDETMDHLDTLFKTKSLKDEQKFQNLTLKLTHLGRKLNTFIQSIEKNHKSKK